MWGLQNNAGRRGSHTVKTERNRLKWRHTELQLYSEKQYRLANVSGYIAKIIRVVSRRQMQLEARQGYAGD